MSYSTPPAVRVCRSWFRKVEEDTRLCMAADQCAVRLLTIQFVLLKSRECAVKISPSPRSYFVSRRLPLRENSSFQLSVVRFADADPRSEWPVDDCSPLKLP